MAFKQTINKRLTKKVHTVGAYLSWCSDGQNAVVLGFDSWQEQSFSFHSVHTRCGAHTFP
jgi:hypothetical protein